MTAMYASSNDHFDWPALGLLDTEPSIHPSAYGLAPLSPLPRTLARASTSAFASASASTKDEGGLYPSLLSILPPSDELFSSLPPVPSTHTCQPPPELLASLAFDPALLIGQLDTQPLSPPTPPPRSDSRKRVRLTGLTSQQRATRKKEQHRAIDSQRRQREHVVVVKMQQLMGAHRPPHHKRQHGDARSTSTGNSSDTDSLDGDERDEDEDEEATRGGRRGDKSDRVSVLERAAERMERMQAVLQQMAATCTAQQQQFRAFIERQKQLCATAATCTCHSSSSPSSSQSCSCCPPHPLSTLHPLLAQQLHTRANSGSLDSCAYLSSSAAMFVVSLTTGRILDVNSRFLSSGGWERHHLVDRNMLAPYATRPPDGPADTQSKREFMKERFLVEGADGVLAPAPLYEQYERSKQLVKELVQGERDIVTAVWRTTIRDGRVVEIESTTWAGGHVEVEVAGGGRVRRPEYLVYVSRMDSCVTVPDDDWEKRQRVEEATQLG